MRRESRADWTRESPRCWVEPQQHRILRSDQPRLPLRQRSTPSSDARGAQDPHIAEGTGTEPSACLLQALVVTGGRELVGVRPSTTETWDRPIGAGAGHASGASPAQDGTAGSAAHQVFDRRRWGPRRCRLTTWIALPIFRTPRRAY